MIDHVIRYRHPFAGFQVYHHKIKPAIAAYFIGGPAGDLEVNAAFLFINGFDACFYNKIFAHFQRALIIHVHFAHQPSKAPVEEFIHTKAIAALHLVVTGGKHIVEILAVMHMVVHIYIIRAYAELRLVGRIGGHI